MEPEDRPREIELKLAISEASARALLEHPLFRGEEGADADRRHEVTTYFDTGDTALARQGVSLRVRAAGEEHVQTVKAEGKRDVAADRGEWEWKVPGDEPDLGLLAKTPVAKRLPRPLDVGPVLATHIDRTRRILTLDGGTVVEAALDEGEIVAGDRRAPVRELELELRHGDRATLYRFAAELNEVAPFSIEVESKAARGYRLRSGAAPAVCRAEDIAFAPHVGAAEAFRALLGAKLGQLLANQPAALAGEMEGVHQMRVSIRRLRAVLALFMPHLEPHAAGRIGQELRRIGRVFGEARDWDVFCCEILPGAFRENTRGSWREMLHEPAEARRSAAHEHFGHELAAPSFTALVLGMAVWSEASHREAGLLGDGALKMKLADVAPTLLDRLARKVAGRGHHFDGLSWPELHAVRKSLKKLRYAVDDLRSIFPERAVKPYVKACKHLQDLLGEINDVVAATALAESLAENRPDLAPSIAALADRLEEHRSKARYQLGKSWKKFQSEAPFWR